MKGTLRLRALTIGGLAGAGVTIAHCLAYRLVAPDVSSRNEMLMRTGHRYFSLVSAVFLGIFAAGVALLLVTRARSRSREAAPLKLGLLAPRLAAFQGAAWFVLEVVERVVVAHHHGPFLTEPVVWIGLVLQVVVAFCAALLLVGIDRAIAQILNRGRPRRSRAAARWPLEAARTSSARGARRAWRSRGPPRRAAPALFRAGDVARAH